MCREEEHIKLVIKIIEANGFEVFTDNYTAFSSKIVDCNGFSLYIRPNALRIWLNPNSNKYIGDSRFNQLVKQLQLIGFGVTILFWKPLEES